MKRMVVSVMKNHPLICLILIIGITLGSFSLSMAATTLVMSEDSTFHDVLFTTEKPQAGLGTALVKGDFNGDGIDDIAMSAIREAAPRTTDEVGMVSVFLGGPAIRELPKSVITGKESDGYESARLFDITISKNWLGVLMTTGDLNGDNYDDLVIAAQNSADDDHSSKIYIIFGKEDIFSKDMALNTMADVTLFRDSMHIGALATGDLNGDGMEDLVISDILTASTSNPPVWMGHSPNGGAYVVLGRNEWPATFNLQYTNGERITQIVEKEVDGITEEVEEIIEIDNGADIILLNNDGEDVLQIAGIAVGDLNNDTFADLALGTPEENNALYDLENAGRVYILFGGPSFPTGKIDVQQTKDVVIYGGEKNDKIGGSLEVTDYNDIPIAIGDVNGDSVGDLLIGSPLSMLGKVNSTGNGKVEVLFGKENWSDTIDLYDSYDIRLMLSEEAQKIGVETGYTVAVEDINGDTIGDIVIGSHHAPAPHYNGYLNIVFGGSDLVKEYDQLEKQSDFFLTTENPPDWFGDSHLGQSFLVGNFDGKGGMDLLASAPKGYGVNADTSAGWIVMLFDAVSKNSDVSDDFCPMFDVQGGYALSIPSISIAGVPGALGIKLVPDATLMKWALVDYWAAQVNDDTLPLGSDWTIHVPCADLGIAKISFSMTLDFTTLQFILDPASLTTL